MAVRDYQFVVGPETDTLPTATDPATDGDLVTLGYANKYYTRGITTIAALKALSATQRTDNFSVFVDALGAYYFFDSASSATGDDFNVVTPTAGTGRWHRVMTYRRYVASVAFNGVETTKSVDVSATVYDARDMWWGLKDVAGNNYGQALVDITHTSATNVTITTDTALPAGTYRLIGIG